MANIQHAAIPDADLHEMKGAAAAAIGTVPFATGTGSTAFRKIDYTDIANAPSGDISGYAPLFAAASTAANQNASGYNSPTLISFGSGASTADVTLDSSGRITFNTDGFYAIKYKLNFLATTGPADFYWWFLYNGTQINNSYYVSLPSASSHQFTDTIFVNAAASDILVANFLLDGVHGSSVGGLATATSSYGSIKTASCAEVVVYEAG